MNNLYMTSGVERALIAVSVRGVPVVLATDSIWIANDCEEVSDSAEDIGLADAKDCPTPGLYLWEGTGKVVNDGTYDGPPEPTIHYEGTLRPVKPEEVAELYAMVPPPEATP